MGRKGVQGNQAGGYFTYSRADGKHGAQILQKVVAMADGRGGAGAGGVSECITYIYYYMCDGDRIQCDILSKEIDSSLRSE